VAIRRETLLIIGLVLFLFGVQFRLVSSFTLSERSSRFIAAQMGERQGPPAAAAWGQTASRKIVEPPRWLGLALMSVGSVLALKSLSMGRSSPAPGD